MKLYEKYLKEGIMHKQKADIKPGLIGIDIIFNGKTIRLPKSAVEAALAGRKITLDIDINF